MTGKAFVHPRDESDPFCTCPSCRLLGTHNIAWEVFRRRTLPDGEGGEIDISSWGDPPDGTRQTVRTCRFCGHIWRCSHPSERRAEPPP